MKTTSLLLACAAAATLSAADVTYRPPNYDETKIHPYTLEDPLTFVDGTKVKTPADWPRRRAEILGIFAREMYGQPPPAPEAVVTEVWDVKEKIEKGVPLDRHAEAVRDRYLTVKRRGKKVAVK